MHARHTPSRGPGYGRALLAGAVLSAALALAGCGGSSGSSATLSPAPAVSVNASPCSGCGTAAVSLTDAPGDFVSYLVTVDSLTLTRSDGTVVQIVPNSAPTQVDFAQLVNLSELVGAHELPAGTYTSAQLTLDYSSATIVVSTANGNVTVPAADLIDGSTGNAINAPIAINLSFGNNPLVISDGVVSNLAIDFNLTASDSVDLTANPVTVTVNPVLTASLTPAITKQIHVRGTLASVSAANSDYVVTVDPFDDQNENLGSFTVNITSSTQFLINGTSSSGSNGLAQLATLATSTLVTAYGTWDTTTDTFTASTVHAGSSVTIGSSASGAAANGVDGTVVARSGDTLTLRNVLLFGPQPSSSGANSGEDMHYEDQVTVTVGSGTEVSALGQSASLSTADISVGQQARFAGALSSSGSTLSLDATHGSVMLEPTTGVGILTAANPGELTVTVESLGHVQASNLDFTGTGASSAQDASATSYLVAIPGSFSTSSLNASEPVQFSGFVTPFGSAPPDFTADSVVSYAQANADLNVTWASPGENTPFLTLTATGITIDQAMLQAALKHKIEIADTSFDISGLTNGLTLLPAANSSASSANTSSGGDSGDQGWAITHHSSDSVDSYGSFSALVTALQQDLSGASVLKVSAQGTYDGNGTLTVSHLAVELDN